MAEATTRSVSGGCCANADSAPRKAFHMANASQLTRARSKVQRQAVQLLAFLQRDPPAKNQVWVAGFNTRYAKTLQADLDEIFAKFGKHYRLIFREALTGQGQGLVSEVFIC